MNKDSLNIIIKILILFPILFYIGYKIFNTKEKLSINFKIFIVLVFSFILIIHFMDVINLAKSVIKGKNIEKAFGFFIMSLAVFLILFNLHKLLRINNFFKY
jgi:hypothetical protein